MTVATAWPSTTPRPLRLALGQLAVAVALLGVIIIAVVAEAGIAVPLWGALLNLLVGWLYVAAGLLAWSRRPSNHVGSLIVAGGLAIMVSDLAVTAVPVLIAISAVVATLPLAILVHLLHAFPSGRLPTRASVVVVAAGYVVSLVLQAPRYLLPDRPGLVAVADLLQSVCGCLVMIATVIILVERLRRAGPHRRRALAPLYGYGIAVVLFIPVSANVLTSVFGLPTDWVFPLQLIAVAGVPVAFTLALLRGGFARTAEIEELGAWLSGAETGRTSLALALSRALGDDSLQLIFWVPDGGKHDGADLEGGEYVHANGDPASPSTGRGRGLVEIKRSGVRVGAIDYDTTLNADPALVSSAGRVVAIAVDHERVTAELRASQLELRRSRERIVRAGDNERRRIARDLHDGLQVRLVLLAMQAQQLAEVSAGRSHAGEAATALREGIDDAAAELRDLVHAVVPAGLIERGLSAATEDLVDHVPIPTTLELTIEEPELPQVVESTAYFVVAEAITNALKHADPTALDVRLVRAGDDLRVEVSDDGIGGAQLRTGSGLSGLVDRVETLGGRLDVISSPGRGTRIVAELPCAS